MSIGFITHQDCLLHQIEEKHVEKPERVQVISDAVSHSSIKQHLQMIEAPLVSREQLLRVHDADYIRDLFKKSPKKGMIFLDEDTQMNPHTLKAAQRAAGAGVHAVDLVMQAKIQRAFCNVRPPGHHAEKNKAMGFCFFNNIAVAASHALTYKGINRVAIIDFDVHHGNGTEDVFVDNNQVMMLSCFQHPLYPWWQKKEDNDRIVHSTLRKGASTKTLQALFDKDWLERLEAFQPDFIFISAGFDAHKDDPIGGLKFCADDYAWMTAKLALLADRVCQGRIVSMLEGGYNLDALEACSVAHLEALVNPAKVLDACFSQKKETQNPVALVFSSPQMTLRSSKPNQVADKNGDLEENKSLSSFYKAHF